MGKSKTKPVRKWTPPTREEMHLKQRQSYFDKIRAQGAAAQRAGKTLADNPFLQLGAKYQTQANVWESGFSGACDLDAIRRQLDQP